MADYAMQQADSLGLEMGIHVCDGFALAGGPWITPEESMQKIVSMSTNMTGGTGKRYILMQPAGYEGYYVGQKYAGSGNCTVAMKALLRAAELGDRQCRPGITAIYFLGYGSIGNEDHCKAAEFIRQWREEGDEEVEQAIELQIKIRSDLASS